MKKVYLTLSVFTALLSISACQDNNSSDQQSSIIEEGVILRDCSIHRDDEFGGAYIDISIADFNNLGFKFGDSLDLVFSNDVTYTDIGYYSGYYVPAGQELVVGYPGYDYIKFCINYGDDVYSMNNFNKDTRVTITVNQEQKYRDIEETLSISYSDDINEYPSKEEFANFREIKVGYIKPGLLYRGASPIDNRRKRAATVDGLLEENNIHYVIDLADKRSTIYEMYEKEDFASPYFQSLEGSGKVLALGMAAAYKTDDFASKMRNMFLGILYNNGPYYIHCLEGKDRTGYVCMVIEALCGATYEELIDDYFITYHNYYGIEKGTNKYDVIKELHIDEMIRFVFDYGKETVLLGANYYSKANNYLLSIGLTQEDINAVQQKLMMEDSQRLSLG